MSRHIAVSICDSCQRGMFVDIRRAIARCYVCLRETSSKGLFYNFDPTGEFLQFTEQDVYEAILRECVGQVHKDIADRMNISPQYLSDLLKGRRPISSVISAYYWLDRQTVFVPRFTAPTAGEENVTNG